MADAGAHRIPIVSLDDPEYARVASLPIGAARDTRPRKPEAKKRTKIVGTAS